MKITYDNAGRLSQIDFSQEELTNPELVKSMSETVLNTATAYYAEITKQVEIYQHEITERTKAQTQYYAQYMIPYMQPQLIQK